MDSPPSMDQVLLDPEADIISKKDLAVRFREPPTSSADPSLTSQTSETDSDSEDEVQSATGREFTGQESADPGTTSTRRRRRGTAARPGTRYAFAHPAPILQTKQRMLVQIRPRLLLQLQSLNSSRPTPAFDVVPSSIIAGSIIIPKLAKRFPRIFMAKPALGPDDLLIVRSEDYQQESVNSRSNNDRLDRRELMAVVSPLPAGDNDHAEIVTGDGSVWSTARMPNGSYEFTRLDSWGVKTTARWVKKPSRKARQNAPAQDPSLDNRWTFSVLKPSTRRHPIMGVLTPHELAVYDHYTAVAPDVARASSTSSSSGPAYEEGTTEMVPEEYRQLMAATASWISLLDEGWPASASPRMKRSASSRREGNRKSTTIKERRRTFPAASLSTEDMDASASLDVMSDDNAASGPSLSGPRRAATTGSILARRRMSEAMVDGFSDARPTSLAAEEEGQLGTTEERGRAETCRSKVRRFTQKLFPRRSTSTR